MGNSIPNDIPYASNDSQGSLQDAPSASLSLVSNALLCVLELVKEGDTDLKSLISLLE